MSALPPGAIDLYRSFIGRTEAARQYLDPVSLKRFLTVLGENGEAPAALPAMTHWAYFLPLPSNDEIGEDGHPRRGGFLPPVALPRRMFASGSSEFHAPLRAGAEAECVTRIVDVVHKDGRSGELVFLELDKTISQDGETCVVERQTIVYRGDGAKVPPVEPAPEAGAGGDAVWRPGPVDLFRFSAVTFNGHRIHYDAPYAADVEGYPGLVVHGPFTASKLCRLAAGMRPGRAMASFAFRAAAPLFCGQPVRMRAEAGEDGLALSAIRQDGKVAVAAQASFH
ncbi:MAG: MaoC family dehydratase N-terminal domain-containing protein [Aquamicrobium sp.]|uniref:FAS1-like dehydratase domain-containing protein n=1 Tax=Aquamicrobium sp. TaxID=1872579 RepID=UPI00349EFB80|nr:MaoC family dehydratase N-terminal domain-containing protein [Aquamicrobium sp.]